MLGSIPVGEPRRENEFGSAIISLLDLSLSQPTMPRPEYRSLLISCLLHLCHSSSYWNEDPVHFLWLLGNITFIL